MKNLGTNVTLSIIVAVDRNGVFGNKGEIPWKGESFMKDDFKNFKKITNDSVCIMGYKTYEEILEMKTSKGGDPNTPLLAGRESFVVTSRKDELEQSSAVTFVSSIREAVENLEENDFRKVFVLGGEKMFIESLPWTSSIYMTVIDKTYDGDRFFPLSYVNEHFEIIHGEQVDVLTFLTLSRVK